MKRIDRNEAGDPTERIFILLVGMFVASLVIAAVLAAKIISVAGVAVPAGVIAYCITFLCTDAISEVWGRQRANTVVWAGFAGLGLVLLLIQLALHWPAAPFWDQQAAFESLLGLTPRIIVGSLAAYLVSQLFDVWCFHFWRRQTKGRFLWLRNNLSTAASQLLDSCIFICIAFLGHMPVLELIVGQWLVKLGIAVVDTAVLYPVVGFIRNRQARLAYS
jgi:hypothetical protein